ncbi:diguanylate cyclase domain-containing protein [Butyrivibrio sp. FCS014]|uniref:diguanylate cyclase domain-containing protein n=1 Tax=Butyrivibrio sp. FCS014 TaxID=1408304 RepID=UPI000465DD79|nr:diguanylate cyclase [Butyrivibrio sp. FCS014]
MYEAPVWFDAVGTIMVAIKLGPVAGALCGILFNLVISFGDPVALPYMLVSAGIGVAVGMLYPREDRDYFGFISAAVLSGVVAALISTPINIIMYGGRTGNAWGDGLIDNIALYMDIPVLNSFLGEAFVDIPDKAVCIIVASGLLRIGRFIFKKRKKTAAALILLPALLMSLLTGSRIYAADFGSEYAGNLYNADTGLESMEINAIAQTKDGYIWVGSYAGLYRYDGYRFYPADIDSRIKNVTALFVDRKGLLWIGTNDSGVGCYNCDTGAVRFYNVDLGLPANAIRAITEDNEGNIYVATIKQLSRITPEEEIEVYEENSFMSFNKLSASGDTVAGVKNDGSLVIFRDRKILYVLAGDYTVVTAEEEGNYIVGTSTNLTGKIYIKDNSTDLLSKKYCGSLTYFNDILYSKEFKGYFVACENGLGFISDKGTVTDLSDDNFDSSVVNILIDYQGNVWFASSKQGVKKYSWNPFEDIFSRAKVDEDVVNSVIVKDGLLYAGTGNGLVTIDLKTYYSVPIPHPEYLKDVRIRNIMCDSKENLWFSTYGPHGLIEMKPDGTIQYFNSKNGNAEGDKFRFTKELSDGRIIAGSNVGITLINNDKVIWKIGEYEGIKTQPLCVVQKDDGTYLVGSDGDGIYVIEGGKLVKTIGVEDGLMALVVMKIVPCKGGFIYVTSNALYYDNGHEIRRLENFPYSNNYDVFISNDEKAWVMSSGGIFVVDERDLLNDGNYNYMLLNRNRGLQTSITSNASYALNGERLYIPCIDGVRRISTVNYDNFNSEYEIRISRLSVGDEEIIPKDGVYHIPATSSRVQFDVAVMNYTLSNPLIHMYLEGADDEGITCNQKDMEQLSFTNLPYGDYVFHVEILDASGNIVVRDEAFPVTKESQIFERTYFRLYLYAVCFLLVLYIGWAIGNMVAKLGNVQRLQKEATIDPLTGLLNKRGAREAMSVACKEGEGVLAVLDLDNFKPVNDLFGHDMGDRILIDLARILKENAGNEDILCRIGGDEFVAFYRGIGEQQLEARTENLNTQLMTMAKRNLGENMNIPLGISIGAVKVASEDTSDYDTLFKKADKALYIVKNSGKHSYILYDEELFAGEDSSRANATGIAEVRTILGERNKSKKPYKVENTKLREIYRLLVRLGDNSVINSVLIHFTVTGEDGKEINLDTMVEFGKIISESLRCTDVFTIDNNTALVIITDTDQDDAKIIIERIEERCKEEPLLKGYQITYEKEML